MKGKSTLRREAHSLLVAISLNTTSKEGVEQDAIRSNVKTVRNTDFRLYGHEKSDWLASTVIYWRLFGSKREKNSFSSEESGNARLNLLENC